MASQKISQLNDGGAVQTSDDLVVNRGGNNFRVRLPEIFTGNDRDRLNDLAIDPAFGDGLTINTDYVAARGTDLVTNGTGLLGNNYNMPASFNWDASTSPNLPASFRFDGYFQFIQSTEFVPVDPNQVYRLRSYVRQESASGDFSAFANGDKHQQYAGLLSFDTDSNQIQPSDHMIYNNSRTTLAAPLSPGDTTITVTDASAWQNTNAPAFQRGIIIFAYKNSAGFKYDNYSKLHAQDMWDAGAISGNVITLKAPLPSSLGNPDDPNGTWPVGTDVANRSSGNTFKYSLFSAFLVPETDTWYQVENFMGGIDNSGTNTASNFPPGAAFAKLFWLANFSNRSGGFSSFPDTGVDHSTYFAGISIIPEPMARAVETASGARDLYVSRINDANDGMEVATGSALLKVVAV